MCVRRSKIHAERVRSPQGASLVWLVLARQGGLHLPSVVGSSASSGCDGGGFLATGAVMGGSCAAANLPLSLSSVMCAASSLATRWVRAGMADAVTGMTRERRGGGLAGFHLGRFLVGILVGDDRGGIWAPVLILSGGTACAGQPGAAAAVVAGPRRCAAGMLTFGPAENPAPRRRHGRACWAIPRTLGIRA